MAEIQHCLQHMVNRELADASNCAMRSTIKMRVLMKIASMLDLSMQAIYETKNLTRIDISCSQAIERIWIETVKSLQQTSPSNHVTSDEMAAVERFLSKDFARNVDLVRLAAVLLKRLPAENLWFVFAVDGLYFDDSRFDLRPYFDNLSIPIRLDGVDDDDGENQDQETTSLAEIHARAIRMIYHKFYDCTPENIARVLKKIFNISDYRVVGDPITDTAITTVSTHHTVIHMRNATDDDRKLESDSSDDDDQDSNGYEDVVQKNIDSLYKRVVGSKLAEMAKWKKSEIERANETRINNSHKTHTATTKRRYNRRIKTIAASSTLSTAAATDLTSAVVVEPTITTLDNSDEKEKLKGMGHNETNNTSSSNQEKMNEEPVEMLSQKRKNVTDNREVKRRKTDESNDKKRQTDDNEVQKRKKHKNMAAYQLSCLNVGDTNCVKFIKQDTRLYADVKDLANLSKYNVNWKIHTRGISPNSMKKNPWDDSAAPFISTYEIPAMLMRTHVDRETRQIVKNMIDVKSKEESINEFKENKK